MKRLRARAQRKLESKRDGGTRVLKLLASESATNEIVLVLTTVARNQTEVDWSVFECPINER